MPQQNRLSTCHKGQNSPLERVLISAATVRRHRQRRVLGSGTRSLNYFNLI
ncbi:hypothetical protein DBV15_00675 [Temnothorax longispinosus]|uniref:Uncharacterized protein n=1 Tax=Temnothorax longispinosus TaxID=300112 RepID=A0A4V3SB07_9HYME|nr:hypothetical protein DBV15_00675 [Temnothorax longispinosus]